MKKPRNQREIQKIKDLILDKALEIISLRGFSSFTMRAVASQTGMSAPNIYNYFSGKDEIYITLIIQGFQILHQDLQKAARSSGAPVEKAGAMICAYLEFGMNNPSYYDIMFTRPTPKYDDYVGTQFEKLSEIEYNISMDIAQLAQQALMEFFPGNSNPEEIEKRLVAIWSLIHGMVSLHNSKVMSYVINDARKVYESVVAEIINSFAPAVQSQESKEHCH